MSKFNDIESQLKEAVLIHLTEEELCALHDNTANETDRCRMESHLARCLICSRKLQQLMQYTLQSQDEGVDDQDIADVRALIGRQRALAAVVSSIVVAFNIWIRKRSIHPGLKARFSTAKVEDGQLEDGSVRWRYVEKESGERIIRFGSHRMELEGFKILLKVGELSKIAVLKPVTQNQVGAEIIITAHEIDKIPAETSLMIDVIAEA